MDIGTDMVSNMLGDDIYFVSAYIFDANCDEPKFLINAWSLVSKYTLKPENAVLRPDFPFAIIDSSVINQSRPFEAVMHSVTLILMFMLSVGLIQIIFALIRKKIFGIFVNLSFIATGLVLWAVDIKIKWLFPIANSAFGWHYDGMYDKTIISIAYSYGYFLFCVQH